MLKSIISFFWGSNDDPSASLTLEEAYAILSASTPEVSTKVLDIPKENLQSFDVCNKTGKITCFDGNLYTIDDLYEFEGNDGEFPLNSKVSYQLMCTDNQLKVTSVNLLDSEWNVVETGMKKWCERIFICNVTSRSGRCFTVDPGDFTIDLNKVSSEFIPIVGDWLEIDAKCVLDENVVDLGGQILDIEQVRPLRPQVRVGTVNKWDSTYQNGFIDRNIYFDKESLYCGYTPQVKDRVVAEIIESNQGQCSWRAVKVVPDYIHNTGKMKLNVKEHSDCLTSHDSVNVTDDITITIKKLGEKKQFEVDVENFTDTNFHLICVELPNLKGQIRTTQLHEHIALPPRRPLTIRFDCQAKNIGTSEEIAIFHFTTVKILRKIRISVGDDAIPKNAGSTFNRGVQNVEIKPKRERVRGVPLYSSGRYVAFKVPDFNVPQKLEELLMNQTDDRATLKNEIVRMKPCLATGLTYMNYEVRFHTLLYLDEIYAKIAMRNYDQPRASFIRNGEYLMLEIDNLAERRPSVIVNDRVIARNPYKETSDFDGYIHKIAKNHVYIKFSHIFHDTYNGEDYEISIEATRTAYRREHYGVHLAVRNLGRDWLFASKVVEKEPQIELSGNGDDSSSSESNASSTLDDTNLSSESSPESNKSTSDGSKPRRSKTLIMQKIKNFKQNNRQFHKIEWFNQSLNHYQKEAVRNILLGVARPLPYIIFGPPGTGKTITVVETVLQILSSMPHARILLTAPSNSASDLLALRLIDSGVLKPGDLVRLVAFSAIDAIPAKLAPYCATANIEKLGTQSKPAEITSSGLVLGLNSKVLGRHRITVSTCCSAGILNSMGFAKGHFSHIIVDEAGQASEPSVLIPLGFLDTNSGQAILAGDPMQMGPVVLSSYAMEYGLEESLLERFSVRFPYARDLQGFPDTCGYDPRLITKLIYNYRSLPELLKLPSMMFYNDDLIPTIDRVTSKEAQLLDKIKEVIPNTRDGNTTSIVLHSVAGRNYQSEDSPSWFNPQEAAQVFYYVNILYGSGLKSEDIGIIAPYRAQIKEIRDLFDEAELSVPKVGTVEEFQGQEYNVIIVSTVRSQQQHVGSDIKHSLGFIASPRRLNVSITRAKCLLLIIGNANLLSTDQHWRAVLRYCKEHGALVGATILDV